MQSLIDKDFADFKSESSFSSLNAAFLFVVSIHWLSNPCCCCETFNLELKKEI
jgi:hypothetical protein